MTDETVVAPKRRGRPRKQEPETTVVVETIRQKCQWCSKLIAEGREPVIWSTCAECAAKEATFLAETPCPHCGGRKGISVQGFKLKNGHHDSCITNADPVAHRRFSSEEVAELQRQMDAASR